MTHKAWPNPIFAIDGESWSTYSSVVIIVGGDKDLIDVRSYSSLSRAAGFLKVPFSLITTPIALGYSTKNNKLIKARATKIAEKMKNGSPHFCYT